MRELYYSVFNTGLGYSEVGLSPTFDGCVQDIVAKLKRPENYNNLPAEIRDNLTTWETIIDNLLDPVSPYRTNWIIEIGVKAVPGFMEPPQTEKRENLPIRDLAERCLTHIDEAQSASFDCISEESFYLNAITDWTKVSQKSAEFAAFIARIYRRFLESNPDCHK